MKTIIIKYLIAILTQFNLIHVGKLYIKFKASAKLSVLLSPIPAAFIIIWDKLSIGIINWFDLNLFYILLVLGAVAVDHAFGSYKHAFIDKDFNFKQNVIGLLIKLTVVVCGGFLFEGLNEIIQHDTIVKTYLLIVCRLMVFLYPGGSAFGNMSVVTGGKFPPKAWLDRLSKFNENLDVKDITGKKDETDTDI